MFFFSQILFISALLFVSDKSSLFSFLIKSSFFFALILSLSHQFLSGPRSDHCLLFSVTPSVSNVDLNDVTVG